MLHSNKNLYSFFLPYTLFGLLFGIYILISGTLSLAWNIVLICGLLTLIAFLMSEDWLRLSLFLVVLSLPLGLSKGLVQLKEVFVPSLLIQLSDFFVFGALFLWAWRIMIKEQMTPSWHKIHTLAFLVISWFAITIINAVMPTLGFFEWITIFKSFLFFLFISAYFTEKNAVPFIWALAFSVIFQIIFATTQQILQNPLFVQGMKGAEVSFGVHGFETFRPRGTLEHPLHLSSFLLYSQPIIFSIAYFYLKGIKKILFLLIFLLSIFIHIWTYSRIGWLTMTIEAMVFIFILIRKRMLTPRNVAILGLCTIIICAILGLYHDKISDRLFGYDNMSTKSRRVMENIAIQVFYDKPISGVGFGNYPPASEKVWPKNSELIGKDAVNSIAGKHYVHNGYLLILSETGIIGIVIWIIFFGNILLCGYRNIIRSKNSLHMSLSIGIFLALIGLLVNMSLEHFRNNMLTLILWMCAGIILALSKWEESFEDGRAFPTGT